MRGISNPAEGPVWRSVSSFLPVSYLARNTAANVAGRGYDGTSLPTACRQTVSVRCLVSNFRAGGDSSLRPSTRRGGAQGQGAGRVSSRPRGCLHRVPMSTWKFCGILGVVAWICKPPKIQINTSFGLIN